MIHQFNATVVLHLHESMWIVDISRLKIVGWVDVEWTRSNVNGARVGREWRRARLGSASAFEREAI